MSKILDKHPYIIVAMIVLFFGITLNYIAHFFLEKRPGHVLMQQPVLENIYGKDMAEDYKIVLSEQGLGQKYYPFVEFIEKPREGKFVNVSEQGTRCHYPDRDICQAGGGQEIWIFGGSTTFGYGVKDNETIAAFLSKVFPEYRIINFGAGYYYSTNERIRFENLLAEFPPPKAAIFIDGLNDFYFFNVPDQSKFSGVLSLILNEEGLANSFIKLLRANLEKLAIYRLFEEKFGHAVLGKGHTPADHEQILRAIHRLNLNHSIVESIGDKFGITILNVIQPIPLYGVGHKTSHVPRKALNFGDHINSGAAYRLMFESDRKSFQPNSKTLNLADLSIEEGMYVDTVHYSPKFNQEIAYKIHTKLSRLLK